MNQPVQRDGNLDFSGGMDTSRRPSLLFDSQYSRACNLIIPRHSNRIRTRFGFHHQKLYGRDIDIHIYNSAKNIQGTGYYTIGRVAVQVKVIDGYVFEFRKYTEGSFRIKILNKGDRNNPRRGKAWVTRIPNGAIINDGESLPIIIQDGVARRSDPSNNEIGVGRMGIYVQNRFFYVTDTKNFIRQSDFNNPFSIQNAIDINIHGFLTPESYETITAIGVQKASLNYIEGGVLSFSTSSDTYTVDVRGDAQSWELQNTAVGKVQETMPGIGAVSAYSYESFNSNLWFRTADFGLMNLKRSQYQFVNDDDYSSQSLEAEYWFSRDSRVLLDKCNTKQFRDRLLTTVAPEINEHGFTFWNGIISMNPDPNYGDNKLPRRFESLMTGVRPWSLTSIQSYDNEFYIDSYDEDGVTRLYKIEEDSGYDLNHLGNKVEIESWIETRGYFHKEPLEIKKADRRYYSIYGIKRNINLKFYSRKEEEGPFIFYGEMDHKVKESPVQEKKNGDLIFNPVSLRPQSRKKINLPKEDDSNACSNPSVTEQNGYYIIQDRIEIKGECELGEFIREATKIKANLNTQCNTEKEEKTFVFEEKKDYTYSISSNLK